MGIERPVGGVEDLGAKVSGMHPCHIPQILSDAVVGVLDSGRVILWSGLDDVGSHQCVAPGLAEVVHGRAGTDGRGVHAREAV